MVEKEKRVIAIDPTPRGFGFVVFEGPHRLIYWSVVYINGPRNVGCVRRLANLLDWYAPDAVIVEDYHRGATRRCVRVRRVLRSMQGMAAKRGIKTWSFSRGAIREAFADVGAVTKDEIAAAITVRYPELAHRLPPPRRTWRPEDDRMSLFDATALYLTYQRFSGRRQDSP
jgi:Holliday junction resolvasome RuvABC endonuclease subunit